MVNNCSCFKRNLSRFSRAPKLNAALYIPNLSME